MWNSVVTEERLQNVIINLNSNIANNCNNVENNLNNVINDVEENLNKDINNNFLQRPLHPNLVGPFKLIENGSIIEYDELFQFEQPLLFNLMGSPLDAVFGLNNRKVTCSYGTVRYFKDNKLKEFVGTENMTPEDFADWWFAFEDWCKYNVNNSTRGNIVDTPIDFTNINQFEIFSTALGNTYKYLNAFTNIPGGIQGFLTNQQAQPGFAFLPIPYSEYIFELDVKHSNEMPLINKINRPLDSGILLDIPLLSSIPVNGSNYDDVNLQGYQLFNMQHPALRGAIVKYPYGSADLSWLTTPTPEVTEQLQTIPDEATYHVKIIRKNGKFDVIVTYDGLVINVYTGFQSEYAGGHIGLQYEACKVDYTNIKLSPVV